MMGLLLVKAPSVAVAVPSLAVGCGFRPVKLDV
jgi:hypothetical protein